jgi:hypothetical protein
MRYTLDAMLPERAFKKSLFKNAPATLEGGSGGGGGGPTQSTSYQTNVPEYAKPYVTNMLESTQKQLFNTQAGPEGTTEITGFKPYQAYGATYAKAGDPNPAGGTYKGGEQTGYDVNKYFAPFSPMQQQAQKDAFNLQTPSTFGQGAGMAGMAGMGALGTTGQAVCTVAWVQGLVNRRLTYLICMVV